jgi:predicted phage-related endonuclease
MTVHNPKSKDEWLALRHKYVSSTESSALKGLSPYMTKFELYYAKKEPNPTSFEMSERMEWGLRMEEAIARAVAEKYGVELFHGKRPVRSVAGGRDAGCEMRPPSRRHHQ